MIPTNRCRVAGSTAASSCSVSMKPIKVASGVRNSWLALATKSTRICSAARAWLWSISRTSRLPPGRGEIDHLPGPAELAKPDQLDPHRLAAVLVAGEMLGRGRVADGEPHVATFDMRAEQIPRRLIGDQHPPVAHDQQRIGRRRRADRRRRLGLAPAARGIGGAAAVCAQPPPQQQGGGDRDQMATARKRRDQQHVVVDRRPSFRSVPGRDKIFPPARFRAALPLLKSAACIGISHERQRPEQPGKRKPGAGFVPSRRAVLVIGAAAASTVITVRPALAQTAGSVLNCEIPIPQPAAGGSYISPARRAGRARHARRGAAARRVRCAARRSRICCGPAPRRPASIRPPLKPMPIISGGCRRG